MQASRLSAAPILGILREQDTGAATANVCRKHGISRQFGVISDQPSHF